MEHPQHTPLEFREKNKPNDVILEERWETGEWFRSGMIWTVGKGNVLYFRLGHETYPIFKQPEVIKAIENACRWLGKESAEQPARQGR